MTLKLGIDNFIRYICIVDKLILNSNIISITIASFAVSVEFLTFLLSLLLFQWK